MGSEVERTVSINYYFKEPDGWEEGTMGTPRSYGKVRKKSAFCFLNGKKYKDIF